MTGRPRPLVLGEGWFPDSPSGLSRFVREFVFALAEGGVHSRGVVLGPASDPPPGFDVPADVGDSLAYRLARYSRAAEQAAGEIDVVDAHFALYAFRPVVAGALRRHPLVVHFHGPWADEAVAAGRRSRTAALLRRRLERTVYRRAQAVVVLSEAFRGLLVERYDVSPERIHVIAPGVDLERFTPGARAEARGTLGLPRDAWVVVTVRRVVERMGLDVLVDACAALPRDGPEPLLIVAGEGPARTGLERRAEALGIAERVRFPGRVDDDLLPLWYRAADVAVVPSTALEGFGLVVLEALACGTPVVATRTGGLPEPLEDLDSSLVVPPGDVRALSNRLAAARAGTAPLPPRDRCRAHAERFTWAGTAARTEEVYERVRRP
jgi:glycosyltransferase involved in cell wall biosynthesis